MIVNTMTIEEFGNAVLSELHRSIDKILGMIDAKNKLYKREIMSLREDKPIAFKTLVFKRENITFHIIPNFWSKKYYKKNGIGLLVIAQVYYRGTNWYCFVVNNFSGLEMYTHHFFERYIERHKKDESELTFDVVREFFLENIRKVGSLIENPYHDNCYYSRTKSGICCGEWISNRLAKVSTYIEGETLTNGSKKDFYDNALDDYELLYALRQTA